MAREWLELGSSPAEEECVQVTKEGGYLPAMRKECQRYIRTIRAELGEEPYGAALAIMSNPHDFGTYLDVVCYYNPNEEVAVEYAFNCDENAPSRWREDIV